MNLPIPFQKGKITMLLTKWKSKSIAPKKFKNFPKVAPCMSVDVIALCTACPEIRSSENSECLFRSFIIQVICQQVLMISV